MDKKDNIPTRSPIIHTVLAHSYSFYFLTFLLGLILDFIFPLNLFPQFVAIGVLLITFGSFMIFWAQKTSRKLEKGDVLNPDTFRRGPYRYTRGPTHWGLAALIIGFGLLTNAAFIVFFAIVSFFLTRYIFLRKEESILEQKYGEPYLKYKKIVKL